MYLLNYQVYIYNLYWYIVEIQFCQQLNSIQYISRTDIDTYTSIFLCLCSIYIVLNTICDISFIINISATYTAHVQQHMWPYMEEHTSVIFSDNAIYDNNIIIYFSEIYFFFHFKAIDALRGRIHTMRYNIYITCLFLAHFICIWNRFFSLALLHRLLYYIHWIICTR